MTGLQVAQAVTALVFATVGGRLWLATCPPYDEIAWMVLGCPDEDEARGMFGLVKMVAIGLIVLAVLTLRLAFTPA